jgi:hypothetical protein
MMARFPLEVVLSEVELLSLSGLRSSCAASCTFSGRSLFFLLRPSLRRLFGSEEEEEEAAAAAEEEEEEDAAEEDAAEEDEEEAEEGP